MEIKSIISKSLLKKTGALLLTAAVIGGGAGWYQHGQEQIRHANQQAAQVTLVQNQAKKQGVVLLDEAKVRSIAAETIGAEEASITFRKITLNDRVSEGKEKHEKKRGEAPESAAILASQSAPSGNTQNPAVIQDSRPFRPLYQVKCMANQVKYSLLIDAVSGQVLRAKVS